MDKLLSLYPSSEFQTTRFSNNTIKLGAEVYRAGRILRDILLTCQPINLGTALASAGNDVYFYNQNQTILTPILESPDFEMFGYGVVHTSEFAYMFANLSSYDAYGLPFHPRTEDYVLRDKESRSWSSFAALGFPSISGLGTLQGWERADLRDENFGVFVIGGSEGGYAGVDGSYAARRAIRKQQLQMRCSFLNSDEIIAQLGY